ncbi:DUF6480 family protein [Streptomyces sp. NPDC048002]|uniref:DUF6480 family protein n=1 Tax=unclassified Streptomyces TaxID=2593676 RepID=UPI0033D8829A
MSEQLPPPGETPAVEGSIAEAHQERPDGGVWDHPLWWLSLIVIGSLLIAAFFLMRVFSL